MRINAYLVRWIRKKYKRLAAKRKALAKLQGWPNDTPACSRTGASLRGPAPYRSDEQSDKSRVTGDCYARFCEGRGVRFPPATRHSDVDLSGLRVKLAVASAWSVPAGQAGFIVASLERLAATVG